VLVEHTLGQNLGLPKSPGPDMASYPETSLRTERLTADRHETRSASSVRILGFGTYDRDKHPRAGILLDGLSSVGEDVRELNEPLGFSTAERVAMLGRPWLAHRMATRLVRRWSSLIRRRVGLRGWSPQVVLVGYLGHFDVILARLLFPRTVIALDLLIFAADTARDRGTSSRLKLRALDALDSLAVRCASVIILDTEEHRSLLPEGQSDKAVVIPVGAPETWFAAEAASPAGTADTADEVGRAEPADAALKVVFFGLYTPLQGTPTIGAAIAALPAGSGVEFTMIGSGQDHPETVRRAGPTGQGPGVRWLDWVEPDELPALVRAHDVCLGIFGDTPKALRVTPNKVYQGAAAGCAIVTSDTAPQRRALGSDARFVPPADAVALAAELSQLAANPVQVRALRAASRLRAEQSFRGPQLVEPLVIELRARLGAARA
jgi:glycosyltransferase involved in cell wall biosynthesis